MDIPDDGPCFEVCFILEFGWWLNKAKTMKEAGSTLGGT